MRFTIQTKELLKAVQACSKVIQSKNAIAILDNVLISKKDELYTLTGANAEQCCEVVLNTIIVNEGEFTPLCVSHKLLQSSLSCITDDLIQVDAQDYNLTVYYEGGKFKVPYVDANEFPVSPAIAEGATEFTVPASAFVDIVKRANGMTADDILRPVMCGVCLDVKADALIIVGSDGHRLYKHDMTGIGAGYLKGSPMSIVIPRSLVYAIDILRTSEEICIKTDGTQLSLSTDDACLISRMIEGRYPNYNSVIPADSATKMTINIKSFQQIIKRVSLFGSDATKMVVLSVKDGKITLAASDIDNSTDSEEVLPVESHNIKNGFKTGLNYVNLLTSLSAITSETADVYVIDNSHPVKFKADARSNEPTVVIQMPMLVQ